LPMLGRIPQRPADALLGQAPTASTTNLLTNPFDLDYY